MRCNGTTRTSPASAAPDWLRSAISSDAAKSFASPEVTGSTA